MAEAYEYDFGVDFDKVPQGGFIPAGTYDLRCVTSKLVISSTGKLGMYFFMLVHDHPTYKEFPIHHRIWFGTEDRPLMQQLEGESEESHEKAKQGNRGVRDFTDMIIAFGGTYDKASIVKSAASMHDKVARGVVTVRKDDSGRYPTSNECRRFLKALTGMPGTPNGPLQGNAFSGGFAPTEAESEMAHTED